MLLRDAPAGLEVLLVRRHARAAFVPGAYVFPGGVVDLADASEAVLARVAGLEPTRAAERLGLAHTPAAAAPPAIATTSAATAPPAIAYYVAALRETFEETGILVAIGPDGSAPPASARDETMRRMREDLLEDRVAFAAVLERLSCRLDVAALEYVAHWITPEAEPRRYDTRFFMAAVSGDAEPAADPREMTDALWIRPADAVRRARAGGLPMILPTVHTLERLADHGGSADALRAFAGLPVPTIMPAFPGERNALRPRPERPD